MGFWELVGLAVVANIVWTVACVIKVLVFQDHELPTKYWRQKYKEWKHGQERKRR